MKTWLIDLAGRLPRGARDGILRSPLGPLAHRLMGAAAGGGTRVVTLRGPLDGWRMRLDTQRQRGMAYGDYEPAVVRAVQTLVQPGWRVADIGAQVGYMTLLLARQVGPTGQVFAFEPMPANFAVLSENLALNGCAHVHAERLAVAAQSGPARLNLLDDQPLSATASLVETGAGAALTVEAVRLDDYLTDKGGRLDFAKLDVEGAEGQVIEGMAATIDRWRPVLLAEIHGTSGTDSLALVRLLELGYSLRSVEDGRAVTPRFRGHVLATRP